MKSSNCFLLLFFAATIACVAQVNERSSFRREPASVTDSWQSVHDKQPTGLRLTLSLPKTHFHMGEVIPATLTFSNESKEAYHLPFGACDDSGRPVDILFRAEGEDGSAVRDPLQWYNDHFLHWGKGKPGIEKRPSPWVISTAVNQWLQFPKPGAYKLYARSSRMKAGDGTKSGGKRPSVVDLVSDAVEITVDPLPATEEMTIIEQAKQVLNDPHPLADPYAGRVDDPALDAIERLRFLQTPAACDALLQFVDSPYGDEAMIGLYARSDYSEIARKILEAVREARLGLSERLESLYFRLKNGTDMILTPSYGGPATDAAACDELFTAARQATMAEGGSGDDFFADLWTLFLRDPGAPRIRAIMIKRQLDLPSKQIDEVFGMRAHYFHEERLSLMMEKDFLPLLRVLVKPENHNPNALAALAAIAPEEARPIIMEDIKRRQPIYILAAPHAYIPPSSAIFALKSLPDRELPELDSVLRGKLSYQPADQPSLEATMVLIERYATKALLPDVVRIYQTNEGHWQCVLQAAVLRYWIRCDPAGGVEALSRALKRNGEGETGCFRVVLTDVLQKAWDDHALPIVMDAVENEDSEVIGSAVTLLEAHAGPEVTDKIIAAIERVASRPPPEKALDHHERIDFPRKMTRFLINSRHWVLTRSQIERLQKVVTDDAIQSRSSSMLNGVK